MFNKPYYILYKTFVIYFIKLEFTVNLFLGNNCVHTLKSNRLKRNRIWKSLIKKSKQLNVPKVKTKPNSKVVVEVCYTKSMVDVIWQVYKLIHFYTLNKNTLSTDKIQFLVCIILT